MSQRTAFYIAALIVVTIIASCSSDSWEGFVYPNRNDLTKHRNIGKFESLEACRVSARGVLAELNALHRGDYECGKNCNNDPRLPGIKICEETLR